MESGPILDLVVGDTAAIVLARELLEVSGGGSLSHHATNLIEVRVIVVVSERNSSPFETHALEQGQRSGVADGESQKEVMLRVDLGGGYTQRVDALRRLQRGGHGDPASRHRAWVKNQTPCYSPFGGQGHLPATRRNGRRELEIVGVHAVGGRDEVVAAITATGGQDGRE